MIAQGQITLDGIQYGVVDGQAQNAAGETVPLKILNIKDNQANLVISILFTPEGFEDFKDKLAEKQIVRPPPNMVPIEPFFTRNGGIRR